MEEKKQITLSELDAVITLAAWKYVEGNVDDLTEVAKMADITASISMGVRDHLQGKSKFTQEELQEVTNLKRAYGISAFLKDIFS